MMAVCVKFFWYIIDLCCRCGLSNLD